MIEGLGIFSHLSKEEPSYLIPEGEHKVVIRFVDDFLSKNNNKCLRFNLSFVDLNFDANMSISYCRGDGSVISFGVQQLNNILIQLPADIRENIIKTSNFKGSEGKMIFVFCKHEFFNEKKIIKIIPSQEKAKEIFDSIQIPYQPFDEESPF